jgi:serine/threonine protein kinase
MHIDFTTTSLKIEANQIISNEILSHQPQTTTPHFLQVSQPKLQKKRTFNFDRSNFVQIKNKSLFDEYEIKEKLGEGAYGCVYKVQQKTTGFIRAVKAIKRKHIDTTAFGNEIEILKTVDHPNIIKLYDCYHGRGVLFSW